MELVTSRFRGFFPSFCLFAAILVQRLIVLARMAQSPFLLPTQGDMFFYNDWARHILLGQSDAGLAFYGLPLYAYLLAAIYYLYGYNPFLPELLQACADAGTALLIFKTCARLFHREDTPGRAIGIGALATIGWAFFKPAQAYSAVLMPTALSTFVFWLVLWQLIRQDELPRLRWFLLLGSLIGLSATGVATILFLLPLIVVACFCKWPRRQAGRHCAPFLSIALLFAGVALGTSPCWIHNYVLARDPVLLSAHSGVNFWIGNNPTATGYPNFPPGLHAGQESMLQDSISTAERAAGHPLKRSQVSAYWSKQAVDYIRHHFSDWLRLLAAKLGHFWSAFQYDDLSIITALREEHVILPGLGFGTIAALALAGIVFAMADVPAAGWIAAAVLLQICALLPVFITERYRLPAAPGLLIFAAYGVWFCFDCCRQVRLKPLFTYAGLLLLSTFFISRPNNDPSLWALDTYNCGIVALDLKQYDAAEKKLALAYAYAPGNAEVNFAMGNLSFGKGDKEQAKRYYGRTIALDPTHHGAYNNLGAVALAEGRWQSAEYLLRRALQLNSGEANTHFLLARSLFGKGDREAADAEIDRAMALDPQQHAFAALRNELR